MTTALDNQKRAISLFQQNNGSESLYLQCQRFDGFYTQSAAVGHWGSATYASAKIAYQVARAAGRVYTSDLNDPRIVGLERVYYDWGQYGHVCAIVGRTADGRLVVTNTANAGDDLGQLGNHVKLSHADSLGLPLLGVSSRDGNNPHLAGFDMVQFGGGAPAPQPGGTYYFDVPAGGQYYYYQYVNALNGNYDPNQLLYGGSRVVVENPGMGPVRIRANDGSLIWVGTRRNPAAVRRG